MQKFNVTIREPGTNENARGPRERANANGTSYLRIDHGLKVRRDEVYKKQAEQLESARPVLRRLGITDLPKKPTATEFDSEVYNLGLNAKLAQLEGE